MNGCIYSCLCFSQLLHLNKSNAGCSERRIANDVFSSWTAKKLQSSRISYTLAHLKPRSLDATTITSTQSGCAGNRHSSLLCVQGTQRVLREKVKG